MRYKHEGFRRGDGGKRAIQVASDEWGVVSSDRRVQNLKEVSKLHVVRQHLIVRCGFPRCKSRKFWKIGELLVELRRTIGSMHGMSSNGERRRLCSVARVRQQRRRRRRFEVGGRLARRFFRSVRS